VGFGRNAQAILFGQSQEIFMALINGNNNPNVLIGTNAADTINGFAGIDVLTGRDGNDVLNGGSGADAMFGGKGNDVYIVDNVFDKVTELLGGGTDTILSSLSQNLLTLGKFQVENLTLTGGASSGFGNLLANKIIGNNAGNTLDGGVGNDTLLGAGGNDLLLGGVGSDTLAGGGGNDTLVGGLGRDIMSGGANDDTFRFALLTSAASPANADVITDFDDFGNDRIDVSSLFPLTMTYRHNLAFSGIGQVRINDIPGADVIVEVNLLAGFAPEFSIRLAGTALASMTGSDFVL
jgi:Ca2+-binding RTX toxin-like protein